MLALGIWANPAAAGETIWEGAVRVVDTKTLAGLPDGPVLPLGGIDPPPPDARCGPAEESLSCRELAVQALRDATAGQKLVCERNEAEVACHAGGTDVAEWLVRMGWATAIGERLHRDRETSTGGWRRDVVRAETFCVDVRSAAKSVHPPVPTRQSRCPGLRDRERKRLCTAGVRQLDGDRSRRMTH